jgi:hypothetical protein
VVVAQRDADAAGGEAVDVVDGGLARAAGHQGALVLERLVLLRQSLGLLRDEVAEAGVEDAGLSPMRTMAPLPCGAYGCSRSFDRDDPVGSCAAASARSTPRWRR